MSQRVKAGPSPVGGAHRKGMAHIMQNLPTSQLSGGPPRPKGSPLRWEQYLGVPEGSGIAGRSRLRRGGRVRLRELAAEAPGEAWPTTPVAPLRQRRCWWRARPGGGSRREREAAAGDPSWTVEEEQADGSCGGASTG